MQGSHTSSNAAVSGSTISETLWGRRDALPPVQYDGAVIEVGTPVALADGVCLLRLPLPFALNHINVYLLREQAGWTLVDTGIDTPESRALWETVLASSLFEHGPLQRIVVTHHHPDHIGLAGWLAQKCAVPLLMTRGEYQVAGRYADPQRDVVAERTPLWSENGLPVEVARELLHHMPRYGTQVHGLPASIVEIDTAQPLELGGRRWIPIVGRGHSPEHLSLLAEDGSLLIGGDQVLPKITPNIAVWPGGDQNPLLSYLQSLAQFESIAPDTLLLPSHRQPLRGVARRVEEIRAHHEERLAAILAACTGAMTGFEFLAPLFGRELRNEEIGFGLGEAIAHLNFLESEGWLHSSVDAAGHRRFERTHGLPSQP
ncbi:MBL fold metallo-hydrolase [Diaphorobacter sp.]|uniref:MBL fold metallo-hydrolase n=1 Tax=Diaphorobacter sp. TaxID=1934310 RepID=UPI0028A6E2E1|nr:MBL fold metallo-hydrolase [Diaphorobacter sp.]